LDHNLLQTVLEKGVSLLYSHERKAAVWANRSAPARNHALAETPAAVVDSHVLVALQPRPQVFPIP
jgi:hypothetical protein